jgi:hypothetical protein
LSHWLRLKSARQGVRTSTCPPACQ